MSTVYFADAEIRADIPSLAKAHGCDWIECPGLSGFQRGYVLAGGGMGTYLYCARCCQIRGKDCGTA